MQSNPVDDGLEKQSGSAKSLASLKLSALWLVLGPISFLAYWTTIVCRLRDAFLVNWGFSASGASVLYWPLTVSAGARCRLWSVVRHMVASSLESRLPLRVTISNREHGNRQYERAFLSSQLLGEAAWRCVALCGMTPLIDGALMGH